MNFNSNNNNKKTLILLQKYTDIYNFARRELINLKIISDVFTCVHIYCPNLGKILLYVMELVQRDPPFRIYRMVVSPDTNSSFSLHSNLQDEVYVEDLKVVEQLHDP